MRTNNKTSRRQWLNGLLRGGVLAVFGATSYQLLNRESVVEEADCLDPKGHLGCRACLELNKCGLPRALSVKHFLNNDGQEERKS